MVARFLRPAASPATSGSSAICHEAHASKSKEDHSPGGWLWHCGNIAANLADPRTGFRSTSIVNTESETLSSIMPYPEASRPFSLRDVYQLR
jgi:hypothetical protein